MPFGHGEGHQGEGHHGEKEGSGEKPGYDSVNKELEKAPENPDEVQAEFEMWGDDPNYVKMEVIPEARTVQVTQRQMRVVNGNLYASGPAPRNLVVTQTGGNAPRNISSADTVQRGEQYSALPVEAQQAESQSAVLGKSSESSRDNNTRRFLAVTGLAVVLAASTAALAVLYATAKAAADGEPAPPAVPEDLRKAIFAQIDALTKASDQAFWELLAKFVTDTNPAIQPPLTLTDNILFCSYVLDHYPVDSFLFDTADDATGFAMQLVAAYMVQVNAGKTFGEGAAAMYRLAPNLMYSAGGAPEAVFPRQVQAMLLRQAFVALVSPTPSTELMRLASEWASETDMAYWASFVSYLDDIKTKPPLTLQDQIEFCNYTAAASPPTTFYFQRAETEDNHISRRCV